MGCYSSAPDSSANRSVEDELASAKREQKQGKKLLLLGAGGSGKSTFFKQLQIIHGSGFSDQEKINFRSKVWEQVLSNIKLLVIKSRELIENDPNQYSHLEMDKQAALIADDFIQIPITSDLTPELASKISIIWKDKGIQEAWNIRAQLCVTDSTDYFINDLERIARNNYLPNDRDLIMNRYMTTGMTEKTFEINKSKMIIVDVGGQRSERRKWIHFFDGVTAVIFVTSLSAYDETLFEDTSKNVAIESLEVFDQIWNSHWFEKTPVILFLNKADLLKKKLGLGININIAFPEYNGNCDFDSSVDFIKYVYESRAEKNSVHHIYSHVTTATDTATVERVFNDVQHIVINAALSNNFLV